MTLRILMCAAFLVLPAISAFTAGEPIRSVVVSFSSACCGPDKDAVERVDAYLAEFEAKYRTKLTVERVRWGREGEFDYCIDMNGHERSRGEELVKGLEERTKGVQLVAVTPNGTCREGR